MKRTASRTCVLRTSTRSPERSVENVLMASATAMDLLPHVRYLHKRRFFDVPLPHLYSFSENLIF
jgi:hypothetical protein